ncbi:MAG: FAD-dependent oxidoreductase [Methylobacter sp.]|nr:FAD-dependent oxidoreductase [Methylobacter sp.]
MNKKYDVVIVGGGVIGAACAYYLSKCKGLKIALIDSKRSGNASRASAGGLWAIGESVGLGCGVIFSRKSSSINVNEYDPVAAKTITPHILPECFFNLALASNALYPALHEELREVYDVDFKFEETGLKFVMYDEEDRHYAEHIASNISYLSNNLRWLDHNELRDSEPYISHEAIGAIEFLCDHQVNPFRLTDAYIEAARQNGIDIYMNTNVTNVLRVGQRVMGVVTAEKGEISCNTLINAAGSWAADISEWATGIRLPIKPIKGQIVLSEKLPRFLHGCVTTSDCYIVQKDNGEILIGSTTEDVGYDTATSYPEIATLVKGAMRCIPELRHTNVKRCWAGLRPGTPDELPILGLLDGMDGYINACGHFRTGILTSAITGVITQSIVCGEPIPVDITPFLATRFNGVN